MNSSFKISKLQHINTYFKEDIQVANEYMKGAQYSSLGEMKMKATVKYHSHLLDGYYKKDKDNKCWQGCAERNL